MTLRALIRQVLTVLAALQRDQHGLASAVGRMVTESAEHTRLLGELLDEIRGPVGTVVINVGPVSEATQK